MTRSSFSFASKTLRTVFGAVALFSAGCAPQESERTRGDTPTFVSLNPCLDAVLVEVAKPEQILALSHYSRDITSTSMDVEVAARFGVTGGTAEEVLALKPDIVLASIFIAPSTRAAFERLGLRVETFDSPTTVAESQEQIRRLAALTGDKQEGEHLADEIAFDTSLHRGKRAISTLVWQPGQIVPGEATLIGEMLREARLESHSAARGLGQGDYVDLETLVADPPELLLVAGDSRGQSHPMLKGMMATEVLPLETNLLFCAGPTIPKLRERLKEARGAIEEREQIDLSAPRQAIAQESRGR